MAKKEWKQKLIPKKALLRASLIWGDLGSVLL